MCRNVNLSNVVHDFADSIERHCDANSHLYTFPGDRYRPYTTEIAMVDPASVSEGCTYEPVTPFQTITVPDVSLHSMCQLVSHYACVSDETLIATLGLMCRYERETSTPLTAHMMHRLFSACVQAAAKFHSDRFADNQRMAGILGLSLPEINQLELTLMHSIHWRLYVSADEFNAIVADPTRAIKQTAPAIRVHPHARSFLQSPVHAASDGASPHSTARSTRGDTDDLSEGRQSSLSEDCFDQSMCLSDDAW
jgi:hypothetical protein